MRWETSKGEVYTSIQPNRYLLRESFGVWRTCTDFEIAWLKLRGEIE